MRIGLADRLVTIETPTETTDESGSVTTDWTAFPEMHARVARAPGREFLAGNVIQDDGDIVFTIRWRSGIGPTARIRYEDNYYSIVGEPVELGRRHWLEIKARRVVQES